MKNISRMFLTAILTIVCATISHVNIGYAVQLSKLEPTIHQDVDIAKNTVKFSDSDEYCNNLFRIIASRNGRTSYNLSSRYTRFGGTIMVTRDTHNAALIDVDIIGDGNVLFSVSDMAKNSNPVPFDIDVSNVNSLVIKTSNKDRYSYGAVYLYDPHLRNGGILSNALSQDITIKMTDMFATKQGRIVGVEEVYDNQRVLYKKDIVEYDATRGSSTTMELKGMYSRLTGRVLSSKDTGWQTDMNIQFIGDGKKIYEIAHLLPGSKWKQNKTSDDFDIDLSNVNILEIKTANNGDKYRGYLYFVNTVFHLKPHDHFKGKWIGLSKPTCYVTGSAFQYCDLCNSRSDTTSLPANGHTAGGETTIIREPQCEEPGISAKYCSICGDIAEKIQLPAIGHNYSEWAHYSGSYFNGPIVEIRECQNCQRVETRELNQWVVIIPLIVGIMILVAAIYFIFRRNSRKR